MIVPDDTIPLSSARLGMEIFRQTGHTRLNTATYSDRSAKQFIYYDLCSDIVLTSDDWVYLNQISNLSLLFAIRSEDFGDHRGRQRLDYFAVVLQSSRRDRSAVAYEVHRILGRLSSASFSIVIFFWRNFFMISWAAVDGPRGIRIVISDWMPIDAIEDSEVTERMNAALFSHRSIPEFIEDFQYSFARPYYLSKGPGEYYLQFELVPVDFVSEHHGNYPDRETMLEISRLACRSPQEQYGYDYIAPELNLIDSEWYDVDDTELLMYQFERELEDDHDGDGIEEPVEPAGYDTGTDQVTDTRKNIDVDEEVLADPIEILRWLEECDKKGSRSHGHDDSRRGPSRHPK